METKTISNEEPHDVKIARLRKRLQECRENMKKKTYTMKDLGW